LCNKTSETATQTPRRVEVGEPNLDGWRLCIANNFGRRLHAVNKVSKPEPLAAHLHFIRARCAAHMPG